MARAADVQDGEPVAASRRLSRGESVLWYGAAATTYIGASIVEKGLLNWFVGPLWLVAFIWLGPLATDRLRQGWKTGRRG
ncbi:MAG: hypothetical protein ACRD2C_19960 [Acidimicrobiales bacterium]